MGEQFPRPAVLHGWFKPNGVILLGEDVWITDGFTAIRVLERPAGIPDRSNTASEALTKLLVRPGREALVPVAVNGWKVMGSVFSRTIAEDAAVFNGARIALVEAAYPGVTWHVSLARHGDPGDALANLDGLAVAVVMGARAEPFHEPCKPPRCPVCRGVGGPACKDCDGEGKVTVRCVECDHKHQHECSECDGQGCTEVCKACGGSKVWTIEHDARAAEGGTHG